MEMMLVAGYSGIGKSALVQEIYKPITQKRGYFISGKFDQLQHNIPYSAVVKAFSGLVRQLLTESEEPLHRWKEKLLAAFGSNGQIIMDVIPELELIVGKQPPVIELGPAESQNRFNQVFQNFVRVFCQKEHPLVLFLDDLQWADLATLKLIELILASEQIPYLFLIGAYRDNEVSPTHPLMITLEALRKEGVIINLITLAPLKLEHITQLMADTLHSDEKSVQPLAKLVMRKTGGNPFFVNQFLNALYQENLLAADFERKDDPSSRSYWHWDLAQIEAMSITDNVVELMIRKLKKLPESTQQVLRLAACVGNGFDLNTLSIIYEKGVSTTFQDLLPAIQEGFILPTSELVLSGTDLVIFQSKFLHDRVQQAAYELMDEEQKKVIHLRMGRLLLANTSDQERVERIFELVDHLNVGREWIHKDQERVELARLNLAAGQKAKNATAYASALQYLTVGMECLTNTRWIDEDELTLALYKERAEVEYLNGHFEQSEVWINRALAQAKSVLEKAEIYNILIMQYTMVVKYREAVQVGRKALEFLDMDLPEEDLQIALEAELTEVREKLGKRSIASLSEEPDLKIPEKRVAAKLLANILPPASLFNQDLFALIVVKLVNLSLKYGLTPESSQGYARYGILLGSMFGDYRSGYEFGLLALKLSERFNDLSQKCRTCFALSRHLHYWVKPLKSAQAIEDEGYRAALESGELQYAGYILYDKLVNSFHQGKNLEQILMEASNFLLFSRRTKNQTAIDNILAYQLVVLNLSSLTQDKFSFYKDKTHENQYLEDCLTRRSLRPICIYQILKSQVLYQYDQPAEALRLTLKAREWLPLIRGTIPVVEYNFYYSLCLSALYPEAPKEVQKQYQEQLEMNQNPMKIWADHCPENFLHKYLLVEAERARIYGRDLEAMDLYDQAIESARKQEFLQGEGLANELAAKFWSGKSKEAFAKLYMTEAHYRYQLWGAKRKVEDLEEKYPQLLVNTPTFKPASSFLATATQTHLDRRPSRTLDLAAVVKASQAISGEILLDKLLAALMKIVIEHAGAQTGFLILSKEGQLLIEASGVADQGEVAVRQSIPIETSQQLPVSMINYVVRTHESVILDDVADQGIFTTDP
ncbi:MAG: AAA family ATPase, partial [Nitrospira sp.]|nr:AAA family ATPase [Nitrospira sp.]